MIYRLAYEREIWKGLWRMEGPVHLTKKDYSTVLCGKKANYVYGSGVRPDFPVSCEKCRMQAALEALTDGYDTMA